MLKYYHSSLFTDVSTSKCSRVKIAVQVLVEKITHSGVPNKRGVPNNSGGGRKIRDLMRQKQRNVLERVK